MLLPLPLTIALGLCTLFVAHRRARGSSAEPAIASAPPPRLVRFTAFMGPQRASDILYGTALRSPQMEASTVTGDVADYRRSRLLWRGEDVAPDVTARVRAMAPDLARMLGIAPFSVGEVETQVTVSGPGDYFKRHDDNGSPETAARRLSWVYYVHSDPKPFTGGELVMYGARGPDGQPGAYVIEPENDSLVVFPSECLHEVRAVHPRDLRSLEESAGNPLNSRVTVNGWVREQANGNGAMSG